MPNSLTIQVSDEHLLRALVQSACITSYDDDDVPTGGLDLREEVRRVVKAQIEGHLAALVRERFESVLDAALRSALDEGFPVVTKWGDATGERKTLRQMMGEFATSTGYQEDNLQKRTRKAAQDEAEKVARATVRSLEAEIVQSMRDAAAAAMAGFMAKALK